MLGTVLPLYGLDESEYTVKPFGNGLINHTWKIISAGKEFLLQRINGQVFKNPGDIMDNCRLLESYFKTNHPEYLFVAPLLTTNHRNYVIDAENNYYRLFPFVRNSYTINTVSSPIQAFEAAKQFGQFTRLLSGFDPSRLKITIPDFHNLPLRFKQFESSVQQGNKQRITLAAESIDLLKSHAGLAEQFEKIKNNPSVQQRVVHHDAKINNVLFEIGKDRALCVIDLDTVMPGYFISDVGDMFRTYLSPAGEEEQDFSLIHIRVDYFQEIVNGYFEEMGSVLSRDEKKHVVYSGKFAIYMQALRFLTDHLNDDLYYNALYKDHNLVRANNQIVLLNKYLEQEARFNEIIESV